jgi:hypothetical protein
MISGEDLGLPAEHCQIKRFLQGIDFAILHQFGRAIPVSAGLICGVAARSRSCARPEAISQTSKVAGQGFGLTTGRARAQARLGLSNSTMLADTNLYSLQTDAVAKTCALRTRQHVISARLYPISVSGWNRNLSRLATLLR